ncbi:MULTISPECIES: nuclear transport factor 2 family protein [unclassified Paludibacterium]|uniref:nuclear transport factor 2 family protein n=1 Tax=unclassified Paludibacterium TaxID=2618429 RepID=UPI001C0415DC|nr:nuclear transport factor 2 family protein [Paludibacterium sp. B53371]BEV71299.1 hypothetical protein THUN1379_07810 [Paludibacterium sp. THUN1379]
MSPQHIVRQALETILSGQASRSEIEQYIAPTYQQWVDGHQLDYPAFLQHLATLNQRADKMTLQIDHLIAEDKLVFSQHQVRVDKTDGGQAHYRVMALFTLQDSRIVRCEELTYMQQGQGADRDMGSR